MIHRVLILSLVAASSICLPHATQARTLDQVLSAMDEAAGAFRDMSASLKRVDHTAIINDDSVETGTVLMQRSGPRQARLRIDFTDPDPRTVTFSGRRAEVYYPKIRTVHIYDLGQYRELVDQFLLLGFGTSGRELQKSYTIKITGQETIGGQTVTRLELVPRSASAREHLSRVELWIADEGGHPLQQKFYQPSGDYSLITYSDLKINPGLRGDALEMKLPGGVKRIHPQK
jgi:outer membrane lipoprotein-sorting protein